MARKNDQSFYLSDEVSEEFMCCLKDVEKEVIDHFHFLKTFLYENDIQLQK